MMQWTPQGRALGHRSDEDRGREGLGPRALQAELVGDPETGVIAGGVITTFLDQLCGMAAVLAMERADDGRHHRHPHRLHARRRTPGATCWRKRIATRSASNVAFVRAVAYEDSADNPIAHAAAAFMVNTQPKFGAQSAREEDMSAAGARSPPRSRAFRTRRFLGVRAELKGDELTLVLPYSEHLVGNPLLPALHGGVVGALMELTAITQLAIASKSEKFRQDHRYRRRLSALRQADRHLRPRARGQDRPPHRQRAGRSLARRAQHSRIAAMHGHFLVGANEPLARPSSAPRTETAG